MSPEELLATLHPDLRSLMEQVRSVLTVEGSVVFRREADRVGSWRLRFHLFDKQGEQHHVSVKLPDEPNARAVREIIRMWREEKKAEVMRLRNEERALVHERRQMRRMAITMAGGGRRGQKVAAAFDKAAAKGSVGLLAFAMDAPYMQRLRDAEWKQKNSGLW